MWGSRHRGARCREKRLRHHIKEFVKMQGAHEARAKFDAMVSTEIKAQAARLALEQGRYPTPRARVEVKTAATAVKEATAAAQVEAAAVQAKAQVEAAQVAAAQVEAAQVAAIQVAVAGVEEETIQAKQLRMFREEEAARERKKKKRQEAQQAAAEEEKVKAAKRREQRIAKTKKKTKR